MDQDNTVDSLSPDLDEAILELIRELYVTSKPQTSRHNEQEQTKLNNMTKVAMLNEVEQMIL